MTSYLVLRKNEGDNFTVIAEGVQARSARGAIHAIASQLGVTSQQKIEYVAVPIRHWQVMSVKVSVQTKLEIS